MFPLDSLIPRQSVKVPLCTVMVNVSKHEAYFRVLPSAREKLHLPSVDGNLNLGGTSDGRHDARYM